MRINFNESGHEVVDEVVTRSSSTPERIGHDLIKFTGFNVWTGPGMTGTQLVVGTHFALSVKDEKRSTRVGFDLFTLFAVTDAAYLNVPLYLTYTTCGDYLSIENIGEAALPSINLFTTDAVDLSDMKIRERRLYRRMVETSPTQISLSPPSGATIEGLSEYRLYEQYASVTIERVSETEFVFVNMTEQNVVGVEIVTAQKALNGKRLYKKLVSLGVMPDNTTKIVPHNITNLEQVYRCEGFCVSSSASFTITNNPPTFQLYVTSTNITLATATVASAYSCTATLLYTKT